MKSWEADSRRRESELSAALRACEHRAQEACRQRDSQAAAATSAEARVKALQEAAHEAESLNRQRAWDSEEALRSSQQEVEALTKKLSEVEASGARSSEALERRLRDAQHAAATAQRQAATSKASCEERGAQAATAHRELSAALNHAEERARDAETRSQAAEDTLAKVEAKLAAHAETTAKATQEVVRLTVLVDTTAAARDTLSAQLATAVAQASANAEATAAKAQDASREAVAAAREEWKRDAEAAAAQTAEQWASHSEAQPAELNRARAERDDALAEAVRWRKAFEARPAPLQRPDDLVAPNASSWSLPPTPSPLQLQEEGQEFGQEQPVSNDASCENSDSFMPAVSPPRLSTAFDSPVRLQPHDLKSEHNANANGSDHRDDVGGGGSGDCHTERLEEENRRLAAAVGAMRRELLDLHQNHAASTGHAAPADGSAGSSAAVAHSRREEELNRREVEEQSRRANAAVADAAAWRSQVQRLEAKLAGEAAAAASERARLMQASNRLRGQVAVLEAQKVSSDGPAEADSCGVQNADRDGSNRNSDSSSRKSNAGNEGNEGGADAASLAARAAALEAALWEVAAENKALRKDVRRARAAAASAAATTTAKTATAAESAAAQAPASTVILSGAAFNAPSSNSRIELPPHLLVSELRPDLMKPALRGLFVSPKRRLGSNGSHNNDMGREEAASEGAIDDNDDGDGGDSVEGGGPGATLAESLDGTAIVSALVRDVPAARLLLGDATSSSSWHDEQRSGYPQVRRHSSGGRGISGNSSDALTARARAVVSALGIPELAGLGRSSHGKASSSSSSLGVDVAEFTALWAAWAVLPKGGLRAAVATYARHFPASNGARVSSSSSNSSSSGGGERSSRSHQASSAPNPNPPPPVAAPAVALTVAGYHASGRPPAAPDRSATGRTLESQRRSVVAGNQLRGSSNSRGGSSSSGTRQKETASAAAAEAAPAAAAVARVRNYNDLRHESAAQQAERSHILPSGPTTTAGDTSNKLR